MRHRKAKMEFREVDGKVMCVVEVNGNEMVGSTMIKTVNKIFQEIKKENERDAEIEKDNEMDALYSGCGGGWPDTGDL